jgi:hypothetical protein
MINNIGNESENDDNSYDHSTGSDSDSEWHKHVSELLTDEAIKVKLHVTDKKY